MKRIRTRHRIDFPPAHVWAVLTDFRAYADWNPLNVWADGDARRGARVAMRYVDAGGGKGKVIAQTVTITDCVPERRLEWVGRIPLLFTGRSLSGTVPLKGPTVAAAAVTVEKHWRAPARNSVERLALALHRSGRS